MSHCSLEPMSKYPIENSIFCTIRCTTGGEDKIPRIRSGILIVGYILDIKNNQINKEYFFIPIEEFSNNKSYYAERAIIPKFSEICDTINKLRSGELEINNLKDYKILDKVFTAYYIRQPSEGKRGF